MRIARHGLPGREQPVASGSDGVWRDLRPIGADIDPALLGRLSDIDVHSLPEVTLHERFGPPLAAPGKIVCVGLNYRDHALETGAPIPEEPILFLKAADTIVGPNDAVIIPQRSSKTDWEVELAVVIAHRARYLGSAADAARCIAGYTISHDVSEREFQLERGGQWDKGKNCETFNPLGPWIRTADEIPDPQDLGLRLWVNGKQRQSGHTSDMIFGVCEIVRYVSQFMVLHPGDIINTGTPAGVALGSKGCRYLRGGDVIELEIDGLGRQRQLCREAHDG